jgi:chromatin remodeling complex protein RSC6
MSASETGSTADGLQYGADESLSAKGTCPQSAANSTVAEDVAVDAARNVPLQGEAQGAVQEKPDKREGKTQDGHQQDEQENEEDEDEDEDEEEGEEATPLDLAWYSGEFVNDYFHGKGRFFSYQGTYDGSWENGLRHGEVLLLGCCSKKERESVCVCVYVCEEISA